MCNANRPNPWSENMQIEIKKISLLLFTFIIYFTLPCLSQERIKVSNIISLEQQYQSCLDKGTDMLGCSIKFYKEMDSCLNIAYVQLRVTLDVQSKASLKEEQLAWLKARDLKFQKIDNVNKGDFQDKKMFKFDAKANFVMERTINLIKRTAN